MSNPKSTTVLPMHDARVQADRKLRGWSVHSPSRRIPSILTVISACIVAALYLDSGRLAYVLGLFGNNHHLRQHHFTANHGVVVSQNDECSRAGGEMLRKGGNAADAMITTVLCLGVVAMYHGGIGGGGFSLVRTADGKYQAVDFRETAPAAASEDMFVADPGASLLGGLAAGVPGELKGLEILHRDHARLPWKELFQPAIHIARHGFVVTKDMHSYMTRPGSDFLLNDPCWAQDFAPDGYILPTGSKMTRSRYADTLEKIAEQGAGAFYSGPIARATVQQVQEAGGIMKFSDLYHYEANEHESLSVKYRDFQLTTTGAPSSGAVVLSIMKTIEEYSDMGQSASINLSTHRINEAMRFAYAERVHLGDPGFLPDLEAFQNTMINDSTAQDRRKKLSDSHTLVPSDYNDSGFVSIENNGTQGIVTMDKSGLTVALTTTVNSFWGSTVCIPETGVLMNNQMNDFGTPGTTDKFGLPAAPANFIRPRKRPLSSISPMIIEHANNHSIYLTTSVAGGSHIPTTTAWLLWHILDMNDTTSQALARPRLHDQLYPNLSQLYHNFDKGTRAFLISLGHNITYEKRTFALGYAIRRGWDGAFDAAYDPALKNGGVSNV